MESNVAEPAGMIWASERSEPALVSVRVTAWAGFPVADAINANPAITLTQLFKVAMDPPDLLAHKVSQWLHQVGETCCINQYPSGTSGSISTAQI
ncbi:MAG TPA: hypothetical protein V6D03_11205 [Candidatus Caenarcaniphilales bacterium]